MILAEAQRYLSAGMWWLTFLPGACLVAVVLLIDRLAAHLRTLLDPTSAHE